VLKKYFAETVALEVLQSRLHKGLYIHSTSQDEIKFIQVFSKKVMPHFKVESANEKITASA
jgi:hypothetical protein